MSAFWTLVSFIFWCIKGIICLPLFGPVLLGAVIKNVFHNLRDSSDDFDYIYEYNDYHDYSSDGDPDDWSPSRYLSTFVLCCVLAAAVYFLLKLYLVELTRCFDDYMYDPQPYDPALGQEVHRDVVTEDYNPLFVQEEYRGAAANDDHPVPGQALRRRAEDDDYVSNNATTAAPLQPLGIQKQPSPRYHTPPHTPPPVGDFPYKNFDLGGRSRPFVYPAPSYDDATTTPTKPTKLEEGKERATQQQLDEQHLEKRIHEKINQRIEQEMGKIEQRIEEKIEQKTTQKINKFKQRFEETIEEYIDGNVEQKFKKMINKFEQRTEERIEQRIDGTFKQFGERVKQYIEENIRQRIEEHVERRIEKQPEQRLLIGPVSEDTSATDVAAAVVRVEPQHDESTNVELVPTAIATQDDEASKEVPNTTYGAGDNLGAIPIAHEMPQHEKQPTEQAPHDTQVTSSSIVPLFGSKPEPPLEPANNPVQSLQEVLRLLDTESGSLLEDVTDFCRVVESWDSDHYGPPAAAIKEWLENAGAKLAPFCTISEFREEACKSPWAQRLEMFLNDIAATSYKFDEHGDAELSSLLDIFRGYGQELGLQLQAPVLVRPITPPRENGRQLLEVTAPTEGLQTSVSVVAPSIIVDFGIPKLSFEVSKENFHSARSRYNKNAKRLHTTPYRVGRTATNGAVTKPNSPDKSPKGRSIRHRSHEPTIEEAMSAEIEAQW